MISYPASITPLNSFCLFVCFGFFFFVFWLRWVLVAVLGLSLVAASQGYSLLLVRGLLTAVASLVAERGL